MSNDKYNYLEFVGKFKNPLLSNKSIVNYPFSEI